MVCIAHVILARQGVLRHRSSQLISFGEFGVTLGDGTVVPAASIVCCYGVCRFHQEIIDAGDIHIVTNQGQLCLINDVVGIS
ncbi:MAG TPA: hypothetical protein VEZ26_03305, partial [Sphingomonadaceae bacterium]|nr:hypothetical protein [Sphingomonadaceae bacterium]